MFGNRRASGALEGEVLATLWGAPVPMTVAGVREALGGELAYTTVLTTLSRLLAKGAVQRQKIGRGHVYRAVLDDAERAAEQMRQMIERRGDHEAVLARFYLPLAISLLLIPAAHFVVRHAAPDLAARAVLASALVAAFAATWALALLAGIHAGQEIVVGGGRRWTQTLAATNPVPEWISVAAAIMLVLSAMRCVALVRRHRRSATALRHYGQMLPVGESLTVVDDPRPDAFAVPGTPGRVVITSGLLRVLEPREYRVVLEHERAHLRHGHHRFRIAMEAAVAMNPLLAPVRASLRYAVERWADEEAAGAVGDRRLAAASLAHAALAGRDQATDTRGSALDFARLGVAARVAALHAGAPPHRRLMTLGGSLAVAVPTVWAAGDATISLARMVVGAAGVA